MTKFDETSSSENDGTTPELKLNLNMLSNQVSVPSARGDGSSKILKISGIKCEATDLRQPLEAFGPLANLENY